MIIENSRYFGKELVNAQAQQSNVQIGERIKKPFSMIPRSFTMSLDEKENKLFRRPYERMSIEEAEVPARNKNPQYVPPYSDEILSHLIKEENNYQVSQYMEQQPDISTKMRAILIDWLVDVHCKFKLREETLYLTVSLIDRYLTIASVTRMRLQLVGVAALFIACKYEEIYPPALKDFVYITDNAYVKNDVLEMEGLILQALNFNICNPTPYTFFQKYTQTMDPKNASLVQYILELSLVEYKFVNYKPSFLVQSAIFLVNKIRKQQPSNDLDLRPCAKELCQVLQSADLNTLQAVRRKFNQVKYHEVSRIRVEKAKQ